MSGFLLLLGCVVLGGLGWIWSGQSPEDSDEARERWFR